MRVATRVMLPFVIAAIATAAVIGVVLSNDAAMQKLTGHYVRAVVDAAAREGSDCQPHRLGLYYSPSRKTALLTVNLGNDRMGGIVWRVATEEFGRSVALVDQAYEAAAFSDSKAYWCRVLTRDGYIGVTNTLVVSTPFLFLAFSSLASILASKGYGGIASYIRETVGEDE